MPANDRMTASEFRTEHTQSVDADSAIAIDPGKTTGVAHLHSDGLLMTHTSDFWEAVSFADHAQNFVDPEIWIVEAPYATQWGKAQDNSGMAYNSGGVAREAELLVEGLRRRGYDVLEHDPHSAGDNQWTSGKWDSETARKIVGDWEGPDNEHTRDALKMLFIYNVI